MTPTSTPAGGIPLSAAGSTSSTSGSTGTATAATSTVAPAAAVSAEHAAAGNTSAEHSITNPAAAGERASLSVSAEAAEASAPRRRPQSLLAAWSALLALCLAMLVEMVNNSILNIAVPTIGRDLHAGPTDLQGIVGAYSLTFSGLLMVGGTLGDKLGRRRTLPWGLSLFGLAGLAVLLVLRLFDREDLRTRAIGLIMVVSMIGFAIGPTVAGLAITHLPWQALLVLNAPMAAIAWCGVRFGLDADDPADLRQGGADVPGAVLSVAALGLTLYSLTLGTERGWSSPVTLLVLAAGLLSLAGFVRRERTAADPMLELRLLAGPAVDRMVQRLGHWKTTAIGVALLLASLLLWIYAVDHGYLWCAIGMLVMTTGAVALLGALPEPHTSIGSAMNDTAQELGNELGVAVVGTVMAAVMGTLLPEGAWDASTVSAFVHSQRISFGILAAVVVVLSAVGVRTLTDSRETEEH